MKSNFLFYNVIVNTAIELSQINRCELGFIRKGYSALQWLNLYGTVHIDLGRGCGKTTYILDHCTDEDYVILPSRTIARLFYEELKMLNKVTTIICAQDYNPAEYSQVFKPKMIYIEEPHLVYSTVDKDTLLGFLCDENNPSQTIVELGA